MKLSPDTEITGTLIGFRLKERAYMDTYLYLYWAGWPWPLTTEKQEASSSHHVDELYQVVRSWTNGSVFILPTMYPATFSTYVAIRLWRLTSDLEKTLCIFSHHADKLFKVVCSWSLRFILYPAYNIFLLSDNTTWTFDLQPCKTISIFSHHADQMYEVIRYWS